MGHIHIDLPNTNNKWVEFVLLNIDTLIIHVGFELVIVDTIRTLTRNEHKWTRITTPNFFLFFLLQFLGSIFFFFSLVLSFFFFFCYYL